MADDRVEIEIVLDDGSIRKGFARFESEADKAAGRVGDKFSGLGAKITAALAALGAGLLFKKVIGEASDAEDSVQKLNTALRLAGSFSEGASQQFQSLATELQKTTVFSDEQVLSVATLARNYAKTNEETVKLTKAAIDFASATGIDAESAVRKLGGTLSGELGAGLTKVNPLIKNFTEEQLRAGAALDSFAGRFAGAAAANANTFSGQVTKASNAVSDLLEEIGGIVTKSPATLKILDSITKTITGFTQTLAQFAPAIIAQLDLTIQGAVAFAAAFSDLVFVPLEVAFNTIKAIFKNVVFFIQGGLSEIVSIASKVASFFAPNSELAQNMASLAESTSDVFKKMSTDSVESIKGIFSTERSAQIREFFVNLKADVEEGTAGAKAGLDNLGAGADALSLSVLTFGGIVSETFGKTANVELIKFANSFDKTFVTTGVRAVQAFGGAIASGMAAVGRTLVNGGNLFKAFGQAMLGALGQALIMEGATRIIQGIARLAASYGADPTGYTLIGVGSTMSVLGGALTAIGQVSAPSTPGAPGVGDLSPGQGPNLTGDAAGAVDARAQQRVTVNVQGDVLDSKETGLRIVDILNDAFNSQGAQVLTT